MHFVGTFLGKTCQLQQGEDWRQLFHLLLFTIIYFICVLCLCFNNYFVVQIFLVPNGHHMTIFPPYFIATDNRDQ